MKRPLSGEVRPLVASLVTAFAVFGLVATGSAQVVAPAGTQAAPAGTQAGGYDPASEATIQTNKIYRLRQGDEITLTVFGEPTFSPGSPIRVLQGGSVSVPLVGEVKVGGLTTTEASEAITKALHKYVRDPHVTVGVYSVGPIEALVLGNVKVPGKYTLPPPARLTDVIAAAGGLGVTDGDLPDARLESPTGLTTNVSLQALLHDGNEKLNVPIDSGETVYVPSPAVFVVQVTGAVDHPGDIPMHEGDDVVIAVARAGASTNVQPDLNMVSVSHTGPDGARTVQTVNLYPILQKGDLTHDVKLAKGDIVYVPQSKKKFSPLDILSPVRGLFPY